MTDMVLIYGRAFGNAHEAQRLYQEEFPGRRLPHHTTFSAVVQRLRENRKFEPSTTDRGRNCGRKPKHKHAQIIIQIRSFSEKTENFSQVRRIVVVKEPNML
ncbi:hypothetical protein Zmor_014522 [Zophobas morio]|uniref:DUF4817 domain-containing protein n=1 Tax=Zophobas morio TaxID=2755281 RepID=A0AA38MGX3_9CUCU|nr:hypothetical protein Zmor_014522 [Zophobas morio]